MLKHNLTKLKSAAQPATKTDLQSMQVTLVKWIVGTGIALFAALRFFPG